MPETPNVELSLVERLKAALETASDAYLESLSYEQQRDHGVKISEAFEAGWKAAVGEAAARIEALEKALRPFEKIQRGFFVPGNCGPDMPRDWPDDLLIAVHGVDADGTHFSPQFYDFLSIADFRAAAQALSTPSPTKD